MATQASTLALRRGGAAAETADRCARIALRLARVELAGWVLPGGVGVLSINPLYRFRSRPQRLALSASGQPHGVLSIDAFKAAAPEQEGPRPGRLPEREDVVPLQAGGGPGRVGVSSEVASQSSAFRAPSSSRSSSGVLGSQSLSRPSSGGSVST